MQLQIIFKIQYKWVHTGEWGKGGWYNEEKSKSQSAAQAGSGEKALFRSEFRSVEKLTVCSFIQHKNCGLQVQVSFHAC